MSPHRSQSDADPAPGSVPPRAGQDGAAPVADGQSNPVLRAVALRKRYGQVEAMRDVHLDVHSGEVVALVGDNGAGKSTFVKSIAGVHEPDGGQMWLDGNPVAFRSPHDARIAGIEVVYQDLALAPDLPVWANLFLGRPLRLNGPLGRIGQLNKRAMRAEAVRQLERLHIRVKSVDVRVENLSGGQRQALAVARAVAWRRKLVIFDEPTNNLGVPEQIEVVQLIGRLAAEGTAVVIVSHNLEHVFRIAHRISVLRNGKTVASVETSQTTSEQVIGWITGLGVNP